MLLILSTYARMHILGDLLYNVQFGILDINSEMASTAGSHVEGVIMVFCSTWWLIRVCGKILCNHGGILAAFGL